MKKIAKIAGTIGMVGCAVMSPLAAAEDSGWLVGGSIGQTKAKIDDARITAQLAGSGFVTTSMVDDKRDTGYKIFGGYKFNPNFALEGGYFDLGKFGFTSTTIPAGTLNGNIKLRGLNLDAVGMLPITERFSAFGRFGAQYAQAKDSFTGTGAVVPTNASPKKSAINYKAGLGVQYNLTDSLGLRGEWERFRINDGVGNKGDVDMLSVGLVFLFGESKPAPVEKVLMPKPVVVVVTAPAPPPKVVVVTAPAPPPEIVYVASPRKVVFSSDSEADALFSFGKTTLTPIGKRALDKFAAELKGSNFEVIKITGHTDRIGSEVANKKLSTRRAEAVKAYLVASAGIPANKVSARGMGGSEHLTKPNECTGTKATKKLVTCLAPDRRVEVEVTGTRPAK